MRPLHVPPPSGILSLLGVSRRSVLDEVRRQLQQRDASYVVDWELEHEVDLHIAFAIAEHLKQHWQWPNAFVLPSDPFELLNPLSTGILDDGLDAVECVVGIEERLGLPELPETFWAAAYTRTFVDVVRFLEAEMSARNVAPRMISPTRRRPPSRSL